MSYDQQQSVNPTASAPEAGSRSSFDLRGITWDWQPDGHVIARGTLSVTRADGGGAAMTLSFELPLAGLPPQSALKDPQNWVLGSLRRALRR